VRTYDSSYVSLMLREARRRDVDLSEVLSDGGVDIDQLEGAAPPLIPTATVNAAWEHFAKGTGDEIIGVRVAERGEFDRGAVELLRHSCGNASTLRSAFSQVARFARMVNDDMEVVLSGIDGGAAVTRVNLDDEQPNRYAVQFALRAYLRWGRAFTGADFSPRSVHFVQPEPSRPGDMARAFGTVVHFEAQADELIVDDEQLDLPVVGADPTLRYLLDGYGEKILDTVTDAGEVSRVRRDIYENLASDASLAAIADRLELSERTLQRRLSDAGTSHQTLLEAVRRQLAEGYLQSRELAITEIGYMLGYGEVSSFARAFRRWFSVSPAEFREKQRR